MMLPDLEIKIRAKFLENTHSIELRCVWNISIAGEIFLYLYHCGRLEIVKFSLIVKIFSTIRKYSVLWRILDLFLILGLLS